MAMLVFRGCGFKYSIFQFHPQNWRRSELILARIFFVSNGILSPLGEITVLSPCKAVWFISSVKMGWTIQNHTHQLVTTTSKSFTS